MTRAPLAFLLLLVTSLVHAQTLQYSPTAGGTYKPLDGAVIPSGTKINIRLMPCPTTKGWQFALNDKALPLQENVCPIAYDDDNSLVAFEDGPQKVSITGPAVIPPAVFTVTSAPSPPVPQPATGTTITWTAPTQNIDGSTLTDLAGFRIYTGTTKVAELGPAVTSWSPTTSGTYYLTSFKLSTAVSGGFIESAPTASVAFVLAASPPPPSVLQTTSTVAYALALGNDRLTFLIVGSVPLGTACVAAQQANAFNVVPRSAVRFDGPVKPTTVFGRCGTP